MITDIAAKLADELITLHARVAESPFFPPPSGRRITITDPIHLPPITKTSRAVSLPPIMPDHVDGTPTSEILPSVDDQDEYRLGDGLPQYQPFWYVFLDYVDVVLNARWIKEWDQNHLDQPLEHISINIQNESVENTIQPQFDGE
jgi:hypothetical protein